MTLLDEEYLLCAGILDYLMIEFEEVPVDMLVRLYVCMYVCMYMIHVCFNACTLRLHIMYLI